MNCVVLASTAVLLAIKHLLLFLVIEWCECAWIVVLVE